MRDFKGALSSVLDALTEQQIPSELPDESDFYGWHPLPLWEWAAGMQVARDAIIDAQRCWTGSERFLDIGCGIGTKLWLAQEMGWRVAGVERWEPFADVALSQGFDVTIGEARALASFDADLVYVYRLCLDLDDERELVRYVSERMPHGSLLFHAGGPDPDWLEHVGASVWRV